MSTLISVLSAVFWGLLLLSVLVFVHEGGHFVAARAFGMRVTEFFLGLPCRYRLSHTSATRGTEIGVTPVLLGGYNKICGMEGLPGEHAASVLGALARLGRADVESIAREAGCSEQEAIDELAVLVDWASVEPYFDEAAGEHPGQRDWPRAFQTVRRDAQLLTAFDAGHDFSREGVTEAGQPHRLPDGGADALLCAERGRTYQGKGALARIVTLVAGPAVNVVVGLALIAGMLSLVGVTVTLDVPVVGEVSEGSIAEAAGVLPGDEIVEVAGVSVETWTDMGEELRAAIANGEPFEITLTRSGQTLTLSADPASKPSNGGLFGITASTEQVYPSLAESLGVAWRYVTLTASSVIQLLQPQHTGEVVSQSSSVVGISVMASEAASSGAADFIFLMAVISLSLGFMNLLPIPPLDGGKIVIELVQLVARRPVPLRVQTGLSYVGLALALLLFVFVLRNDITRFVLGG